MAHNNTHDSRTSSPSLSERVRSIATLRGRFSSSSRAVLLEDVTTPPDGTIAEPEYGLGSSESSRSVPAPFPGSHLSIQLDSSRTLHDRIRMIELVAQDAMSYPLPVLMSIWQSVQDLYSENASPEARKACFTLATSIAELSNVSIEFQQQLYRIISIPVAIELLGDQTASLKALTRRGARTMPFSPDIGKFLTSSLGRHFAMATAARKRNRDLAGRDSASVGREKGLSSLFSLIANIEKQNPGAIEIQDQSALLEELFAIGEKTSYLRDMKNVVAVLGPIVRASSVPKHQRAHCVQLLCAITNAVKDEVNEHAKEAIIFMLKTDYQLDVVKILLDNLSLALSERHTAIVCGSLSILLELIRNKGQKDLPLLTFGQFIQPFSLVHYGSRATRSACLQTISVLLADPLLRDDILTSDWKSMIHTVLTATGDEVYEPGQNRPIRIEARTRNSQSSATPSSSSSGSQDTEPHKDDNKQKTLADAILTSLQKIATSINSLWLLLNPEQRELVARFYGELIDVLPQTYLLHLLDSLLRQSKDAMSFNLITPGTFVPEPGIPEQLPKTTYNIAMDELIDLFVFKHKIPAGPYARIMQALREDFKTSAEERNSERVEKLVGVVKRCLTEFQGIQQCGWQKAAELAQTVAVACKAIDLHQLDVHLGLLSNLLYVEPDEGEEEACQDTEVTSLYKARKGMANVTLAMVDVLLYSLPDTLPRTMLLFDKLVDIAKDKKQSPGTRLPALRLLARVRCDSKYAVMIAKDADGLKLAFSLRRTEGSKYQLAQFQSNTSFSISNNNNRTSNTGEETRLLRRSRNSLETAGKPAPKPPLWMYPGGPGLPEDPPEYPSSKVSIYIKNMNESGSLKMVDWLSTCIDILQSEDDWEVYSYVAVHLPSQLTNPSLFEGSIPAIKMLRNILVGQLLNGKIHEPPADTNVKKGDVAFCLMQSLLILLGYSEHFSQNEQDEMIKVFLHGIGTWDRTAKVGIHALTIACQVMPVSIQRMMGAVILKLERFTTTTNLTIDILEFLGGVARVRNIHGSLTDDEHKKVLAICLKYLELAREQRSRLSLANEASQDRASTQLKNSTLNANQSKDVKNSDDPHKDLPQYVFVLCHHVLTYWFTSLKLSIRDRATRVIIKGLIWKDAEGVEQLDEQSQVTLDMMRCTAWSNLVESKPAVVFTDADGPVEKKEWLVGMSLVTIETGTKTGVSHVIKRQISSTSYAAFKPLTMSNPAHYFDMHKEDVEKQEADIFPEHIMSQLTASIAPTPKPMHPVRLPNTAAVKRAIEAFDRLDTIDGYRIGVIYIRDGAKTENEILSGCGHSHRFTRFLEGLGTKVELKNATFNTQGLDTAADQDGVYTYAWRDRLVEIVYHVPSMMPNFDHDYQYTNKKRHIGNNYVNIIWNESGSPFSFDTFSSEFNCVNIVITPENSQAGSSWKDHSYSVAKEDESAETDDPCYIVQTMTKSTFPKLSPCATAKLLPLTRLGPLVRQMALNCAIFSNVWVHREDGEYVSSWRNRLREIVRLREIYDVGVIAKPSEYADPDLRRRYVRGGLFSGRWYMEGACEEDKLSEGLESGLRTLV